MAEYRNETKGARTIKLTGGGHLLVDAGATVEIEQYRVIRLAPGLVLAKADKVTKAPAKAVANVTGGKAAQSELATARADYKAKFKKNAGPRWDVATIRAKIAEA